MARKNKSGSVKIDFSGVESFAKMDEGEQALTVKEVTKEKGDAGDYLKWILENEDEARVYHNTSLSKASLWATKGFLEALGVEIPDDEFDLDLEDMVGKEITGTIELETYQGKKRPKLVDFSPAEDSDGKGKGKGGKKKDKDEAPDFDEMDEDDLKKFIKKNKLDVDADDFPKEKKLRAAVAKAYEEENSGGDDKKPSDEDVDDMDEEELVDVVKDRKLDVDLDDFKTLRKKQGAVKKALEDE